MIGDIDTYNQMIEVMLNEDDDSLSEFLLMESDRDEVMADLGGDTTLMNYLYLFEEFLDQHDIYLFKGWDTAQVIGKPVVEKFWITVTLLVSNETDLRGAKRVNDAIGQGKVTVKTHQGGKLVTFMILKQSLDQIEKTNKDRIEELSDQALETL